MFFHMRGLCVLASKQGWQARLASKAGKQGWLLKLASKAGTVLIQHVPKLAFFDFDVHDVLHFLSTFLHVFLIIVPSESPEHRTST